MDDKNFFDPSIPSVSNQMHLQNNHVLYSNQNRHYNHNYFNNNNAYFDRQKQSNYAGNNNNLQYFYHNKQGNKLDCSRSGFNGNNLKNNYRQQQDNGQVESQTYYLNNK